MNHLTLTLYSWRFVSIFQNESDCPGYPTEWYTVDGDGVQIADMTADEFQSKIIDLSNGFLTLFLPLSQPLLENAVTLNMTKFIMLLNIMFAFAKGCEYERVCL